MPPIGAALGGQKEDPGALAMALDEAAFEQQLKMARDTRLRLAEDGDEFADRQFRLGEQGEQAQPRRFAGRGERVQQDYRKKVRRRWSSLLSSSAKFI